jgi:hypothetical protein
MTSKSNIKRQNAAAPTMLFVAIARNGMIFSEPVSPSPSTINRNMMLSEENNMLKIACKASYNTPPNGLVLSALLVHTTELAANAPQMATLA